MKNWTIGKRMVLGFSALMALMLCLGTLTWFKMVSIKTNLDSVTKTDLPALSVAGDIRYLAVLMRVTNFKHVVYSDPAMKKDLEKQAEQEETEMAEPRVAV